MPGVSCVCSLILPRVISALTVVKFFARLLWLLIVQVMNVLSTLASVRVTSAVACKPASCPALLLIHGERGASRPTSCTNLFYKSVEYLLVALTYNVK
jgi:hypothetical protein